MASGSCFNLASYFFSSPQALHPAELAVRSFWDSFPWRFYLLVRKTSKTAYLIMKEQGLDLAIVHACPEMVQES